MPTNLNTDSFGVGVVGNNFGYKELLPVLNSIKNVSTTFARPREYLRGQEKQIIELGTKIQDFSDMLGDERLRVIFIAVPPNSQFLLGKAILESNKNLYCEKPIGLNFNEANELNLIRTNLEKNVFVGFQFRFDPGLIFLKSLVTSKFLTEVSRIEVNWHTIGSSGLYDELNWRNNVELGGGVHRDFLSHVIDYLRWTTNDLVLFSLANLTLDTAVKPDTKKVTLISDESDHPAIKINISRGMSTKSFWNIVVIFDSGECTINSEFPFSMSSYSIKFNGNTDFCSYVSDLLVRNNFLVNGLNLKSAREYALKLYFEKIVDNIFKNGRNILPNLEDAKFTQKISDNIQELLLQSS